MGHSYKRARCELGTKRVQITEERRAFYQDQWSAVGNEGSGTILGCLEKKVLDLGGVL